VRLAVLLLLGLRSLLLFAVMLLGASNSFAPSLKAKSTSSAITSASKSRLAILRVQTVISSLLPRLGVRYAESTVIASHSDERCKVYAAHKGVRCHRVHPTFVRC
jgi:hypothetical protein